MQPSAARRLLPRGSPLLIPPMRVPSAARQMEDWERAAALAFEMRHPGRLLRVVRQALERGQQEGGRILSRLAGGMSADDLRQFLEYCRQAGGEGRGEGGAATRSRLACSAATQASVHTPNAGRLRFPTLSRCRSAVNGCCGAVKRNHYQSPHPLTPPPASISAPQGVELQRQELPCGAGDAAGGAAPAAPSGAAQGWEGAAREGVEGAALCTLHAVAERIALALLLSAAIPFPITRPLLFHRLSCLRCCRSCCQCLGWEAS